MTLPHERINFNLRTNKRIERRMIADALSLLSRYDNPTRFAYIGMGAYYFADFVLMHKVLGIDQMISIEAQKEDAARFQFNRPLGCIEMRFGTTHEVLPTLEVFAICPVIVWLDYYGEVDDAKLGDIELVAAKCQPGSVVIVTVNGATPATKDWKLEAFEAGLSEGNRPPDYSKKSLSSDEAFADLCRVTLATRLEAALKARGAELSMRQIFNFRYSDGMKMATYGWLIPDKAQAEHLDRAPALMKSPGIARGKKPIQIDAPVLTFREMAHLRTVLPNRGDEKKYLDAAHPIPKEPAKRFAALYRYFPTFAHIEE